MVLFTEGGEIPDGFNIDVLLYAHHNAAILFGKMLGSVGGYSTIGGTPQAEVLLASNDETVSMLRSNFPKLPPWVWALTAKDPNIFILHAPRMMKMRNLWIDRIQRGLQHEFLHILFRSYGLKLPLWADEGIASSVQKADENWLSIGLGQRPDITLRAISENGIFGLDKNPPRENLAYQLLVHVCEQLGRTLQRNASSHEDFFDHLSGPFSCVLWAGCMAAAQNLTLDDYLATDFNGSPTNKFVAEAALRERLGLPVLVS